MTELPPRLADRLIPEPNTGCWLWLGYVNNQGYGVIGKKHKQRAHRLVYECLVGPIPSGLQLDHKCRVRSCVNPDHLEPVTNRENTLRGQCGDVNRARRLSRTHCSKGHPFEGENLKILRVAHTASGTLRECRICRGESTRRYRERRKAVSQ